MGLDVYLTKYKNLSEGIALEEKYSEAVDGNDEMYKKYKVFGEDWKSLSKEESDRRYKVYCDAKKAVALEMGLDEDGEYPDKEKIEIDHPLFPDHIFKIGYFRSSYNESGINRVLHNLIGIELFDIFATTRDEYRVTNTDWHASLRRCDAAIADLKAKIDGGENYRVCKESYNEFSGPPKDFPIKDEKAALDLFLKELRESKAKPKGFEGGYSSAAGSFYFDKPLELAGVVHGVNKRFFVDEHLPCTFLIYKDESLDWYLNALKIVKATIEHVINDKSGWEYIMRWSG